MVADSKYPDELPDDPGGQDLVDELAKAAFNVGRKRAGRDGEEEAPGPEAPVLGSFLNRYWKDRDAGEVKLTCPHFRYQLLC